MKIIPFSNTIDQKSDDFVILVIGKNSWKQSHIFRLKNKNCILIPPYKSSYEYDWSFIEDREVIIHDTERCYEHYVEEIAKCLLIHGSKRIIYVDIGKDIKIFDKEANI